MNSYPSPQYRQEDQNQGGILDTLGKIALGAGAGVGLLYGLNPKLRQSARQRIADIVYDPKVVEKVEKVREVSKASPETVTTAFRSERPRGTQVVNLNPSSFKEFSQQADQISAKVAANIDPSVDLDLSKGRLANYVPDPWSGEMPPPLVRTVQVSEVPNVQSQRLALPAAIKEDPYVPASSSEPPSWQSAGNMIGDYGQIYGAFRSKETTQAIEQARRQAAADSYVNAIRSNPDSYQLSLSGINPELIALRSKEGLPSPGELTGIAESRPLSAAPQQGSFALTYNQARGAVAPDVGSRLKAKGLGMAGMPGEGPLEIDFEGRRTVINSPAGEALLKSAGVTAGEAESYWSNKLRAQGLLEETSVEAQKFNQPLVSNQAIEAIDTGADQAAMRVSRTVQRDPGESLTRFEQIQDAYEQRGASPVQAADAAVAATEGNVAFTQTDRPLSESSAARFLAAERDEIASQLAEQGLLATPGRIEGELANRLGSDAYKYGPEYTQLKQNIQLGATYDPELFDNPSKPFVRIAGEDVSTGRVPATRIERTPYTNELIAEDVELGLRQPTYMKETAERLQEQAEKKRDWLGSVRLEEASKNAKLNAELINTNRRYNEALDYAGELNNFLDSKTGTPQQRTRARQRLDDVNYELDRLDVLSEDLNQAIYGGRSGARVRGSEKFTEDYIASLTPPSRLKPGVEEGQRLYFEVDELTREPIPGTQELKSERRMIDTDTKGGGGRKVAEYTGGGGTDDIDLKSILSNVQTKQDPREYSPDQFARDYNYKEQFSDPTDKRLFAGDRTQTGREIDTYGIRLSSQKGADPSLKPSEPRYTKTEIVDEAMRLSSASPEGDVPIAPDYEAAIESLGFQPKTAASMRSVLMSEATLKAQREKANRNPRGGKIPGELETLRRSMPEITALNYGPRSRVSGLPPQQRTIPGVTGYDARQRQSQADIEAQQLESYMKKRMIGRSTPLTSEVVIQPKLF